MISLLNGLKLAREQWGFNLLREVGGGIGEGMCFLDLLHLWNITHFLCLEREGEKSRLASAAKAASLNASILLLCSHSKFSSCMGGERE